MVEFDDIVSAIAEELKISPAEIHQRSTLLSFTEQDQALLLEYRDRFFEVSGEIATKFFNRFDENIEITAFFARGKVVPEEEIIAQLKDFIFNWVSGTMTFEFIMLFVEAGVFQQRKGVALVPTIAAYSWVLDQFISTFCSRYPVACEKQMKIVSALRRIGFLHIGLLLEAYAHADHSAIERLATHDRLTGLPNYNLLIDALNSCLTNLGRSDGVCVYFVGLNRFKGINETLGHPVGDQILKEVARRLTGLAEQHLVSRLGGDIFVLVGTGDDLPDGTADFCRRVQSVLERPVDLEGFSVDVTATIGVAIATDPAIDIDAVSLMRQAEIAMYHAKSHQLPTTVFEMEMKRYSVAQLGLDAELRRAIDNNELVLFYQPKMSLPDGAIIGVEALIRWFHPLKGFMNPGDFIPHAEQTVLIHPLTEWVLRTAVTQAAAWRRKGIDLVVSVNLAAPNLQNRKLPEYLGQLLSDTEIAPSKIMLEITESGLMADPTRALATVREFKALGVRLSIDDFGTGYSSLAYLKRLPVTEVKVDRIFVFGMSKDKRDEQIVRATVKLGHSLGLDVAAEGVEDQETLDKLKIYGCDTVQGFFFSKPLPVEELEGWIAEHSGRQSDASIQEATLHGATRPESTGESSLFEWKEEYSTGIEKIDRQHRELCAIVNRISEEASSGDAGTAFLAAIFQELVEYAKTHFDTEEDHLILSSCPDLELHIEEHRHFLEELAFLRANLGDAELPQQVFSFLKEWMTKHILKIDKQHLTPGSP
jgi:hemerythrin-like metal-binding protein/diguanylate cyclase (GGDEF)-like protein